MLTYFLKLFFIHSKIIYFFDKSNNFDLEKYKINQIFLGIMSSQKEKKENYGEEGVSKEKQREHRKFEEE